MRRLDLQGHIHGDVRKDNGTQILSFKKNMLTSEITWKNNKFRLKY